jgi:hypothetical protein
MMFWVSASNFQGWKVPYMKRFVNPFSKRQIQKYSNPSVYEQSVYKFLLLRAAQINTYFSIYKPIFAYMSSFLSQTDRCSCRKIMGN